MLSIIVFHAFFEYDLSSAWRFIRLLQPIWLSVVGEIIFGVGFVSSGTFGNLLTFFLQVNIACKFEFWMKKKKFFHRGSKSRTNSRNFSQTDVIQCAEIKRKCVFYHPLNIKIKSLNYSSPLYIDLWNFLTSSLQCSVEDCIFWMSKKGIGRNFFDVV